MERIAVPSDDIDLAVSLVREAGALAAEMRAAGLSSERKTSVSDIVTAADRAAETLVLERLADERPDDGVVGEEGSDRPSSSGRTWVVDPVDGTYNFFAGSTYWCSAVALRPADADGTDPLLGAVHRPATGETWVGGPSVPTLHLGARDSVRQGRRVPGLLDRPLDEGCLLTYVHYTYLTQATAPSVHRLLSAAATYRAHGSASIDNAEVSTGRAAAWAQHNLPEWDVLPGQAIILGAGGTVARCEEADLQWTITGNRRAVEDARRALSGA